LFTNSKGKLTRRQFIGGVSAGLMVPWLSSIARSAEKRSRIVVVKSQGVMPGRQPQLDKVIRMVEEGICRFTGKTDPSKAWREFVSPDDIVGIKVNPIGGRALSTKKELVEAIVRGLKSAGVKEERIIIWDRFEDHLIQRAGYTFNKSKKGVQCYATEGANGAGYDEEVFYETDKDTPQDRDESGTKSLVSRILTQHITALINVPVLKDHNAAGLTACLKNIAFGSVNNTRRFHKPPFYCDPMIAEICAMPVVQQKLRLNIVDAIEACFDRGPTGMNMGTKWKEEAIFIGTDMVALDAFGLKLVEEKRRRRRLRPISRIAKHIRTAAEKGLGTNNLDEVDVERVNV